MKLLFNNKVRQSAIPHTLTTQQSKVKKKKNSRLKSERIMVVIFFFLLLGTTFSFIEVQFLDLPLPLLTDNPMRTRRVRSLSHYVETHIELIRFGVNFTFNENVRWSAYTHTEYINGGEKTNYNFLRDTLLFNK